MLSIGSLFSGIGGLELGLEWAGLGPVRWQVEIDPWCRSVLARWWPDALQFDDVRMVGARELDSVDLICGGFPCQDISDAGTQKGLEGKRSGLWMQYARVVSELRPRFVVVENVAALRRRGLDRVLGNLARLGYDAEWHCVRASDVGAPHLRNRLFVIAWRRDMADADGIGQQRLGAGDEHCDRRTDESSGNDTHGRRTTLADASGHGPQGEQRPGATSGATSRCAAMADTSGVDAEHGRVDRVVEYAQGSAESPRDKRERARNTAWNSAAPMADADGARRERGAWPGAERGGDTEPAHGAQPSLSRLVASIPKPRVGGGADGLPGRVARWPATPGQEQHAWEPPRTTGVIDAPRLRAIGNAVVPQVAEVIGRRIMVIFESQQMKGSSQ